METKRRMYEGPEFLAYETSLGAFLLEFKHKDNDLADAGPEDTYMLSKVKFFQSKEELLAYTQKAIPPETLGRVVLQYPYEGSKEDSIAFFFDHEKVDNVMFLEQNMHERNFLRLETVEEAIKTKKKIDLLAVGIERQLPKIKELSIPSLFQLWGDILHYNKLNETEGDVEEAIEIFIEEMKKSPLMESNCLKELSNFVEAKVSAAKRTIKTFPKDSDFHENAKFVVDVDLRGAELLIEEFLVCRIESIERRCIGLVHEIFITRCELAS